MISQISSVYFYLFAKANVLLIMTGGFADWLLTLQLLCVTVCFDAAQHQLDSFIFLKQQQGL